MIRLGFRFLARHITVSSAKLQEIKNLKASHRLIYVLPIAQSVDYALLHAACDKLGLPRPTYAPDIHRSSDEMAPILSHIQAGKTLCLFLRTGRHFGQTIKWYENLWEKTLETLQRSGEETLFLPILFSWNQRPGELKASVFDTLFQEHAYKGRFQRLFSLFWHRRNLSLTLGDPLPLTAFLKRMECTEIRTSSKKLRRTLANYLYREKYAMSGPPLQSAKRTVRSVLKDQQLQQEIESFAERKKTSTEEVEQRVRENLKEMMALYSPFYVKTTSKVFAKLTQNMFERVYISPESLARLRESSKHGALIILPNHRSHMDYLVISYLFFVNKLSVPRIAAGINLSFFPMGHIFRRCGAYFIRRSLSGDQLYSKTLKAYVRWLVQHDITQEFFIEGGRSRSGRLLKPKLGLLTFQVESFLKNPSRDILLVPTSMMYDWVPEQESLAKECMGNKKEKESILSLLRIKTLLKRNHGELRIEIGEAISLQKFFQEEIEAKEAQAPKKKLRALAEKILQEISRISKATSRLLASTTFLTFTETFTHDEFWKRYQLLKTCLPPEVFLDRPETIKIYWEQGLSEGWLHEVKPGYVMLQPSMRVKMDYHKQSILHFFAASIEAQSLGGKNFLAEELQDLKKTTGFVAQPIKLNEAQISLLDKVFEPLRASYTVLTENDSPTLNLDELHNKVIRKFPQFPEAANRVLLQNLLDKRVKSKPED